MSPLSSFSLITVTASTDIYTLSLHDALPICAQRPACPAERPHRQPPHASRTSLYAATSEKHEAAAYAADRKSTRLNSSHVRISYAVFCLKKKKSETRRSCHCTIPATSRRTCH